MNNYSIYFRRSINAQRIKDEVPKFDIFISAFNSSARVSRVFAEIRAHRKVWLVHPEYCYSDLECPRTDIVVKPTSLDEVHQVDELLSALGDLRGKSVCIDISGFMRPVLLLLVPKLAFIGVVKFTGMYSEPDSYLDNEATTFSTTTSGLVRPVRGMAGTTSSQPKDHLIIAVGYDHKLISEVSYHKEDSKVYPMFAFPSLSADMYQQSAIRAAESGDVALRSEWISNRIFAPANDPFATAGVISDLVAKIDRCSATLENIYLSPLSTKAQALGFAIYWQLEGRARGGVVLLMPECTTYSRETSSGLKKLWLYSIEM